MSAPPAGPQRPRLLTDIAVLERTVTDLAERFAGTFAEQTIYRYVVESYTALRRTATITSHLTALTRRFTTDRLTALAHEQ